MRKRHDRELKRRERLRSHNVKLNNPQTVIELENEPAYLRRGVQLDKNPSASSSQSMSKYTISDGDDPEIQSNNSFLHDNVD